jgi:hypothetical protein
MEDGKFIKKIGIETPNQIIFTRNSVFVSSPVYDHDVMNTKVSKIYRGGNSIYLKLIKNLLKLKEELLVICFRLIY